MRGKRSLIILAAPSGTGKSTICKQILQLREDVEFSISYTTRAPRPGEENGKDYFFISQKEFAKKIKSNDFLEYAKVHTDFYGTDKNYVLSRLKAGKHILLDIDVQGASQIKKDTELNSFSVFVMAPSIDVLLKRIDKRGQNSPQDIAVRLESMRKELKRVKEFDYLVINAELGKAVNRINNIIDAEESKIKNLENICFK